MKENLTELIVVMDMSGSMDGVKTDAIGGFNSFLESQKALEGEANMTVVLFNSVEKVYVDNKPVKSVTPLSEKTFIPAGMTAMYDAVGGAIERVGTRLSNMNEADRPSKVVVAILTDGAENSSTKFTQNKVFEMIATQRDTYSWEFIFLAAGQEAFDAGRGLGMSQSKMAIFSNTSQGNSAAYDSMCMYTSSLRSCSSDDFEMVKSSSNLQSFVDSALTQKLGTVSSGVILDPNGASIIPTITAKKNKKKTGVVFHKDSTN